MINWDAVITNEQQLIEKQASKRIERDVALASTDWLVTRHRDEVETKRPTSLSPAKYTALMNYRQALRDWTTHDNWVDTELPSKPNFI